MVRKGIVLAGGTGSRLYPLTQGVSKQLMPVFDKPMVYYPLTTLMLAGIREIAIITTREDQSSFERLLSDGSRFGIQLTYIVQEKANGIAEALLLAEAFLAGSPSALVLGDNIFYGHGFYDLLQHAAKQQHGATIFGYHVESPAAYGVVEFNEQGQAVSLEEKPERPKSNYAVTGLYFYDEHAPALAKKLKPSKRGELEITELNSLYLERHQLTVEVMGRGYTWLDTGTHHSLLAAGLYVQTIEERQGLKVGCPEEVAYRMGYIDDEQLFKLADPLIKSGYGNYLLKVLNDKTQPGGDRYRAEKSSWGV